MTQTPSVKRAVDTVRVLSAEGVQKAGSGHPGLPMACADYAFILWYKFMRHNPRNPEWLGRDRFVLSAGHGSMLVYSLLHLFEYGLTGEDLSNFRQLESRTPGHPEYGHVPGVEVTSGPLGTGFATGVGMAMARKNLAARMNDDQELFDQRVFVLSSDGCMMEGVTSEAASLAGHNQLDNLICFYDDNHITIEGSTDLAFSRENVGQRFQAYGWNVLYINGHDHSEIESALEAAIAHKGEPTLIIGRTTIGFGAPNKAGSASAHGEPLGEDELAATKKALGFDPEQWFVVEPEVRKLTRERVERLTAEAKEWDRRLEDFRVRLPVEARLLDELTKPRLPADLLEQLVAEVPEKELATRAAGGEIMQKASALVPALIGGSADLAPSTKTDIKAETDFKPGNYGGRNLHFGVREFAMGCCANGFALAGTAIPYVSTFAVFSDFMKPALRLAAIQGVHAVFIYTHDSIFVGEDGPTHQPMEHLAMRRALPRMTVLRPADSYETAHAWATALQRQGPVAMFLTRQKVENIPAEKISEINLAKGAYVLYDQPDYQVIIIATGSEVMVAYRAAEILKEQGISVRVVSMPSWELFEEQSPEYKEAILPGTCRKRVVLEAGITFGWEKYAGEQGLILGLDEFGVSGPAGTLAEKYGFTADQAAAKVTEYKKRQ